MPGTPCVYWPDCFDWGFKDEIAALIRARKNADIIAGSEWMDLTGNHSGCAGMVKNSSGEESLVYSIYSDYPGPGNGWSVVTEKKDQWRVWGKQ
jgi:alpha-amylase